MFRLPTLNKLEMKTLMVLYRKGGAARVRELRDETGAGSLFYGILGRLQLMGLVEEVKVSDLIPEGGEESKRRRVAVRLTDRGREVAGLLWRIEELVEEGRKKGGQLLNPNPHAGDNGAKV